MSSVDLVFPVVGPAIPRDHGYFLYAGLSRQLPFLHSSREIGIFPIRGTSAGNGTLLVGARSALRVRVPVAHLPMLLPLAGKAIDVHANRLRIGVPYVQGLTPASTLSSGFVLIKLANVTSHEVTPERFLAAARKQLDALEVSGKVAIPVVRSGPFAGQPRRRVMRVRDQTHAGYALMISDLSPVESIRLQEVGIGGRRIMGCGLFRGTPAVEPSTRSAQLEPAQQ